jgi:hypothetical protein
MRVFLLLFLIGCGSAEPPAACGEGGYKWGCATDCPDGKYEPKCGTAVAEPDRPCTFPGIQCEYFQVTLSCDCDGVLHCDAGRCPFGVDMACSTSGLRCGPTQLCVGGRLCVEPPAEGTACHGSEGDVCSLIGEKCARIDGRQVSCTPR